MKKWSCLRSGHCCSMVGTVTMTFAEKEEIERAVGDKAASLEWREHVKEGFTQLRGNPACPLMGEVDGKPTCTVHAVRPYNCRRWGCFREHTGQPYDVGAVKARIEGDRDTRRQAVLLQRRAQPWARKHGWDA